MIPLNKTLLIPLLFGIILSAKAQNILDEGNTAKFAEYLFKTKQYDLASQEFERLVFTTPANTDYKLYVVQSYRLSPNYGFAEKRIKDYFGDSLSNLPASFAKEFLKIHILQGNLSLAQSLIDTNEELTSPDKLQFQSSIYLLGRNWQKANTLIESSPIFDQRYKKLSSDALTIKHKKPILAASLSAIIPGLGKTYCGYWKDGLISLLFVAANSWQAYRGFDRMGAKNATGWIFGSLATGFYFGNIYGSWKTAEKYNKKSSDDIYLQSKNIIFSDF